MVGHPSRHIDWLMISVAAVVSLAACSRVETPAADQADAEATASNVGLADPEPTIPPPEPWCPDGMVPLPEITVVTVIHKTEITEDCYAVPAGQAFTIVFVNRTESLSGKPIPLGLSIYGVRPRPTPRPSRWVPRRSPGICRTHCSEERRFRASRPAPTPSPH